MGPEAVPRLYSRALPASLFRIPAPNTLEEHGECRDLPNKLDRKPPLRNHSRRGSQDPP